MYKALFSRFIRNCTNNATFLQMVQCKLCEFEKKLLLGIVLLYKGGNGTTIARDDLQHLAHVATGVATVSSLQ